MGTIDQLLYLAPVQTLERTAIGTHFLSIHNNIFTFQQKLTALELPRSTYAASIKTTLDLLMRDADCGRVSLS